MITPVSKENEREWAALNVALWPDCDIEEVLQERAAGKRPNEFLYYAGDEAVAFVSLSLRHDYVEGTESSPVGYLEGIYVKPGFRKCNIAKALVAFAKDWSVKNGCSALASDCEWDNEASRLFHNRVGFTEVNRIICFAMDLK